MKMKNLILIFAIIALSTVNIFAGVEFNVSGKVECEGVGISGIRLSAFVNEGSNGRVKNIYVTSDQNGNFSFTALNGDCAIGLDAAQKGIGYALKYEMKKFVINSKSVRNVVIELVKACEISGRITFEDGTELTSQSGSVEFENDATGLTTFIRSDGTYNFKDINPSGTANITIFPNGIAPVVIERNDIVRGGGKYVVDAKLKKSLSLYGSIIDKLTKNVINGSYILYISGKVVGFTYEQEEGGNGEYKIYNFGTGKYELQCTCYEEINSNPIYKQKVIEIELNLNQEKQLDIELERN
ncbi:MAG TPA: hypothetical protein PKK12_03595 [Candidatus Aminicenantes bacterium]|nr:hypothetical protein [Candidatus Aminicenantes bacterium]